MTSGCQESIAAECTHLPPQLTVNPRALNPVLFPDQGEGGGAGGGGSGAVGTRGEIWAAAEKRRLSFTGREGPPQAGECRVKGISIKGNHVRPDPEAEATSLFEDS